MVSVIFKNFTCFLFRRIERERSKQSSLEEEISALNAKVVNANEGLAAAGRLSDQLEKKTQVISMLRQELQHREESLIKAHSELSVVNNAGKVDKGLVKNLVVGYVAADVGKKNEVRFSISKKLEKV